MEALRIASDWAFNHTAVVEHINAFADTTVDKVISLGPVVLVYR